MIVVLADDLSGAAELAGVALQHGLTAEVQTSFNPAAVAEVVCLDSDSRFLSETEAAARLTVITRQVLSVRPAWIFKKCDSVLRGPVLAEARAVARVTGQNDIVLLAANPTHGRVVRNGHYFIADQPLHQGPFAHDPIHPRTQSSVSGLLGGDLTGVVIPDAQSVADVLRHAGTVGEDTLPVGAADLFAALLKIRVPRKNPPVAAAPAAGPTLVVCGSIASWGQRRAEAEKTGVPVFVLPHHAAEIGKVLQSTGRVLLGIGESTTGEINPSHHTRELARGVVAVLKETAVARLMIEGGATSAAVLHGLGWTRLGAIDVIDGVAVFQPFGTRGTEVLIKPGSYAWPSKLWPKS